jgi:hypothetical protein
VKERNKANLKFLNDALGNINDLVSALSAKIDELDEQDALALAMGENSEAARQAAQDRINKRAQLQILKDNVTVLSSNLQSLITRSMDVGATDFDMDAIQSVISETGTMLAILQSGEDSELYAAYDVEEGVQGEYIDDQIDAVDRMVEGVEWLVLEDSLNETAFAQLDAIDDITITAENFNASDLNMRPEGWKELRLKRVLMKEYVERLEGVPEAAISEKRAQRMKTVSIINIIQMFMDLTSFVHLKLYL